MMHLANSCMYDVVDISFIYLFIYFTSVHFLKLKSFWPYYVTDNVKTTSSFLDRQPASHS